ncbi:MAG: translation initiation factor [Deltaproteobacteria bacterium]|nr:translation initiation factor [Deltaproteobacteria bacterium]
MPKDDEKPFNNPFAKLSAQRDALPSGPAQPLVVPLDEKKGPARAVLRRERKGHGGKEVTRVEKLGLNARELEEWCKALKRELGAGGLVEGEDLVFQGDQRERLEKLLQKRGVRQIVQG